LINIELINLKEYYREYRRCKQQSLIKTPFCHKTLVFARRKLSKNFWNQIEKGGITKEIQGNAAPKRSIKLFLFLLFLKDEKRVSIKS